MILFGLGLFCLKSGKVVRKPGQSWSHRSGGTPKFNVNGASRYKPSCASVRSMLQNHLRDILLFFFNPIGLKDSNEVELWAIR